MKRERKFTRHLPSLCGETSADDGIDPAEYFRPARKRDNKHRKAHQLCQQIAETLSLVLSDEYGADLGDLRVVTVAPAPDSTQLLVLVTPADPDSCADADGVVTRLQTVAGRLRTEVAAAITRKRAPKLLFQFLPASGAKEAGHE